MRVSWQEAPRFLNLWALGKKRLLGAGVPYYKVWIEIWIIWDSHICCSGLYFGMHSVKQIDVVTFMQQRLPFWEAFGNFQCISVSCFPGYRFRGDRLLYVWLFCEEKIYYLLSTFCAPYSYVPYGLHMLTRWVLSIGLWNRYYPHVTDEETDS